MLFSGIFILSLLVLLIHFIIEIIKKRYNDLLFLGIPFLLVFLIMFVISDSWWARYSPQIYLIPIMAVYSLIKNKKIIIKLLSIIFLVLLGLNSLITFKHVIRAYIPPSGKTRMNLNEFRNKEINIVLETEHFCGALYNLKDFNIKYNYMTKIDGDIDYLYISGNKL